MEVIGMAWLAALVLGGVLVLLAGGLGAAASSADDRSERDAAELLLLRSLHTDDEDPQARLARRGAVDRMVLPSEVSEALAGAVPRFTRAADAAEPAPDAGPADVLLAHRLHHR